MTGAERGFLLLCSHLGDPARKCLTTAQFRKLAQRMKSAEKPGGDRDILPADLKALGYGMEDSERIVSLLSEEERLDGYLLRAERANCHVLTRFSAAYPRELEIRLGEDAPAVLWYRGDLSPLDSPRIALVGSRELLPENAFFARETGLQAAKQGFSLVSGNAKGADQTAQNACLEAGGAVISVIADALAQHRPSGRVLYLCEDSFDLGFSPIRALSRNRLIHSLGIATLVAQSNLKTGGTWDGSVKNLRFGWSPLYCFSDGRESTRLLEQMGAALVGTEALEDLSALPPLQNLLWQ